MEKTSRELPPSQSGVKGAPVSFGYVENRQTMNNKSREFPPPQSGVKGAPVDFGYAENRKQ